MHLRFQKFVNGTLPIAALLICVFVFSSGCNQQRYKPAPWRSAARKTTLPANEATSNSGIRWTRLPIDGMGTMPMRNALGSTLPGRGWSTLPNRNWTTLPNQNWSTLPNRGGMTTLPQRGGRQGIPIQNWNTLPNRGGMNTLPRRQIYPEYRVPRRNWSTLPNSSRRGGLREDSNDRGGLPLRLPITTLPMRGNPLR